MDIYFEELAYVIIDAWKSTIWRVGWWAKDQGRADIADQVLRQSAGRIPSYSKGRSVFVLLRPSTDQMRPAHINQCNRLHSKSIDLNVNLQKDPQRNIQNNI